MPIVHPFSRCLPFALLVPLLAQEPPVPAPRPAAEPAPPAATAPALPAPVAPRTATGELADLLARAQSAIAAGQDGQALLADPTLLPLREVAAFRALVREHAPRGEVHIAPAREPGTRLAVHARLEDGDGKPVRDALVYAYQTDARGWYADRAPHFRAGADGGDDGHARLFGYVRTDDDGRFVLHTIRPAGYPRSKLPQHVHVHVEVGGREVLVTEILFEDDERLTDDVRAMARRNGYVTATVEPAPGPGDERAADGERAARAGARPQIARAKLVLPQRERKDR